MLLYANTTCDLSSNQTLSLPSSSIIGPYLIAICISQALLAASSDFFGCFGRAGLLCTAITGFLRKFPCNAVVSANDVILSAAHGPPLLAQFQTSRQIPRSLALCKGPGLAGQRDGIFHGLHVLPVPLIFLRDLLDNDH